MLQTLGTALTDLEIEDVRIIVESGLFDRSWYSAAYPDIVQANVDAVVHYVQNGAREGRNPRRDFNTRHYQELLQARLPPGRNVFAFYMEHGCDGDVFNRGMLSAFSSLALRRGIHRLSRLPVYSDAGYIEQNAEIAAADISPSTHAFLYGFPEGRSIFTRMAVSRVLGRLAREEPSIPDVPAGAPPSLPEAAAVYYNAGGNGFLREIASDLADTLAGLGLHTELLDETADIERRPELCVFVGPHEFFHLGRGRDWARDDVIRTAFMFNTEQPQTLWFERGVPFILMSRGVIDICGQVAQIFAECGLPAMHLNPSVARVEAWLRRGDETHPLVRALPAAARPAPRPERPFAERPIDVSFFGNVSAHRERFFVRNAPFFAGYECFLYYRKFDGPLTASWRDEALSRLAGHVAGHSKISLNIHRDHYEFFEWHRIVKQAMVAGSLVVTEPCLPHPLFKPGQHFFVERGRHMPNLIDWLLRAPDGRERAEAARQAALALVHDPAIAAQNGALLAAFLAQHTRATPRLASA